MDSQFFAYWIVVVLVFLTGYFAGSIENEHPGEDITAVQYYQQSLDYLEDIRENTSK